LKGIIFNLLEEVVIRHCDEEMWDQLLDATNLDGAYTSLGSYPDSQLEALVASAGSTLGRSRNECLQWFGRVAMPLLAERCPGFFRDHCTTLPFLISVNDIHPEVRKIHPGALCPVFRFEHAPDGALRLGYESPRQLCALAEGFIEGAADHFGETATIKHLRCTAGGDSECVLNINVHALAPSMPLSVPDDAEMAGRLRRGLERERKARQEAEALSEHGLRQLYERNQQLALLEKIAVAANQATAADDALRSAVREICSFSGWEVGHVYHIDGIPGSRHLRSAHIWYGADAIELEPFRRASEERTFPEGIGLPGRVIVACTAAWIRDVRQDGNFPREKAARQCGLRAASAFPVMC